MSRIAMIIYLVIGIVVASAQGYVGEISNISDFINLVLAVLLWPLLLVGVDFNLRIGGGGGRDGGQRGSLLPVALVLTYLRNFRVRCEL
jgi:ABC-type dipeptide/oligopeptide/nickel transport system permease subunit